jgi:hypothetical protein
MYSAEKSSGDAAGRIGNTLSCAIEGGLCVCEKLERQRQEISRPWNGDGSAI